MGLLDSIPDAVAGKTDSSSGANPLIVILGGLPTQSGRVRSLANKFSQGSHGGAFSSWVGMGENQPISGDRIQKVLGSDQVNALAAKIGVGPAQASHFLAEYLRKVVDELTPAGQVDPTADHQQGLVKLLPSLLQNIGDKSSGGGSMWLTRGLSWHG